jgi:ankyrin repeat protein
LDVAEPSESIEALATVPTGMEKAYVLLLERIEKRRRPTVIKILSWLYRALRPLKQDEIREAIAVRVGAKNLSKPLLPLDSLIQYCQGLVTMDDNTEVVRFSHFTVKEFLSLKHYEDQLLSLVDCSRICLTYMNFEVFEMGLCKDEEHYIQRRNQYPLSEYVAWFWGTYTKGQAEEDEQVTDALYTFFKSKQKHAALRQIRLFPTHGPFLSELAFSSDLRNLLNAWTPLHTVAFEGLEIFYEKIVVPQADGREKLWDVELGSSYSKSRIGDTPLLVACGRGHSSLARLLIKNGADVSARNGVLQTTALHNAVQGGHIEVMKLLLEKDADINAKKQAALTPLHVAARKGNAEAVKLLLGHDDVEVNAKNRQESTPLHLAAIKGHSEVVEMLLDRDAAINAKDHKGWTPLHRAAMNGHSKVVEILLDRDAAINAKDYIGWTPLHRAAWNNQVAIIPRLCNALQIAGINENHGHFGALQTSLAFLTTIFPKDYVFWGALGNAFFDQEMYTKAMSAYDMFAWNRLVTNKSIADLETMDLHLSCWYCGRQIRGYHYKCRKCRHRGFCCRNCVQRYRCIGETPHDPHDLLQIPSHWPLSPPDVDDSAST